MGTFESRPILSETHTKTFHKKPNREESIRITPNRGRIAANREHMHGQSPTMQFASAKEDAAMRSPIPSPEHKHAAHSCPTCVSFRHRTPPVAVKRIISQPDQAGNKFVLTALLVVKYTFLHKVVLMSRNYTVNRKRIPDLREHMAVNRSAA